jgi:hypothetical protein
MLDQIRQRLPNDHLVVRVVFPAPGMPADRRRPTLVNFRIIWHVLFTLNGTKSEQLYGL